MTESRRTTTTFLFTDIQGSTRLEAQVGTARYGQLRERHRQLLRAAFTPLGGEEQGTEGDSFFVTFGSARDALAAAVAGQRASADEPWPEGVVPCGSGWASTPGSRSSPAAASWASTSTAHRGWRASRMAARSWSRRRRRCSSGRRSPRGHVARPGRASAAGHRGHRAAVAGRHRGSARPTSRPCAPPRCRRATCRHA